MSTFDGFVKEFPNIRIDYFRPRLGRPPPAACFLSHIHSDHLQGLESLKMPFVYCSATTRRLLLRTEKYPHRMNFAKGILESRKQTYKHLKFVLRALPLGTATEIELNPTTRIKVTLFDANHCPGAVSFLIEGDGHAILYTGDVRAEPWWVNSFVQNPYILPYACGLRELDCMYLDTTFASHDDAYKKFPTKAEGLSELLQKLSQFSEDTVFYFRAWTLGYEQVWIAMSSLLSSQIHADDYQLRLFSGIVENGRDGFSTFEGPALVGFTVGNEYHKGCLTTTLDSKIHSCEPGTACHAALKTKNVVWITPIISRLDDGTEVLELGAGGGLGDLYQVPELEIGDPAMLEALTSLCTALEIDANSIRMLMDAIAGAQRTCNSRIPLEGLPQDAGAEMSLKDFVKVMSERGTLRVVEHDCKSVLEISSGSKDRVIHFPYSRHSSYDELRHLVSAFRPKDICACTVELASWTEELSMESLFGDLCSQKIFYHDHEVRMEVEGISVAQKTKILKRKRDEQSQKEDQDTENESEGELVSAEGPLSSTSKQFEGGCKGCGLPRGADQTESVTERPLLNPQVEQVQDRNRSNKGKRVWNVEGIKREFEVLNGGSEFITIDGESAASECEDFGETQGTHASLNSSAFNSQGLERETQTSSLQLDGMAEAPPADPGTIRAGASERRRAYDAAVRSLRHNDSSDWDALNLRSVGRPGHIHQEMEL